MVSCVYAIKELAIATIKVAVTPAVAIPLY
jgi:hypothetical protein